MLSCSSEVILRSVQQMAETLKLIFYVWPNCSERNKTWTFKKQSKSQFCCIPKSRRKRNAVNQKEIIKATVKLRALTHLFSNWQHFYTMLSIKNYGNNGCGVFREGYKIRKVLKSQFSISKSSDSFFLFFSFFFIEEYDFRSTFFVIDNFS